MQAPSESIAHIANWGNDSEISNVVELGFFRRNRTASRPSIGNLVAGALLVFQGGLLLDQTLETRQSNRIEFARDDRLLHSAPRFLIVLAVTKAALIHKVEHISECTLDAVARQPKTESAHAWSVNQPALIL